MLASLVVYVIVTPKQGEKFTKFYILGTGSKADDYPTNLHVGAEGAVIIGVVNHECANVTYWLDVRLEDEVLSEKRIEGRRRSEVKVSIVQRGR